MNESTSFRLADKIEKNAEKLEFFMKELLKSSYSEQEIISVNPKIIELDKIIKKKLSSGRIGRNEEKHSYSF